MIALLKTSVAWAAMLLLSHIGEKNQLYKQNRILCSGFAFYLLHVHVAC